MKILHLTHTDTHFDSRILKELGALTETGLYDVTCIGVALDEGASHSNNELNANLITLNLIMNLPEWVPRPIRYFLMLTELTIRMSFLGTKLRPDVVHCHDTIVLPIGVFIKNITRAKLIYDAHELESNKNGQSKILSRATLFIEKRCWRGIDHLISVSDSIIGWYEKKLGSKPNTLILNSPLISRVDQKSKKYFHQLYTIPEENLIFVYLGILGSGRGIDYILDAFSRKNTKSHVVFIGYGELKSKIKDVSKTNTNIHYHKAVAHEEVVSLVKNADVGLCLIENVSLSDFYCLPNKLFEYTFAGLPVLASNFPDIKNIVIKYNLGRVCDINSKSINEAVSEIEVTHLSSINSDLTELGWPNQAEKLRKTYNTLTNKL